MKCIEQIAMRHRHLLRNVHQGQIIKFVEKFHVNMSTCTPYMVGRVSDTYVPVEYKHQCKIPVMQMRTGNISFVDPDREVYLYPEAEMHTRGT